MLKPIYRIWSSPALGACQYLMRRFAHWLCDPSTAPANLTQASLQPPVMPSVIEADWLWGFLQTEKNKQPLMNRALVLLAMPAAQKSALDAWIQSVSALASYFQPGSAGWPVTCPLADQADWEAFKTLMEAFYDKGFRAGLPYLANGTPVAVGGVTYDGFVRAFRYLHRLNPSPDAREVCVLCGGPLGDTPHVDHWIIKSAFPILSVCADNLTLICSTCNEAPNKGEKPVHSGGSFADWFHPYLRPTNGVLQLDYDLHTAAVRCSVAAPADQPKAVNLDGLLKLTSRWTREFKAEYAKHQDILRRIEDRRLRTGQARHSLQDLTAYVKKWEETLSPSEPHHEVHTLLEQAMSQPARMQAWLVDLGTVQ